MIRGKLRRVYWALQRWLAPGLRYSQDSYEEVLSEHVTEGAVWSDLGCGQHLLPPWRRQAARDLKARVRMLIGLDVHLASLQRHSTISKRCCADISRIPLADQSVDIVSANMVVEHLVDPAGQFREIRRVLRSRGHFVFHTPNRRSYASQVARLLPYRLNQILARLLDGRQSDAVFPTYYRANTSSEIMALAHRTGLEVVKLRLVCSTAVFAMIAPLAAVELVWLRLLMKKRWANLRPTIIAVLRRVE